MIEAIRRCLSFGGRHFWFGAPKLTTSVTFAFALVESGRIAEQTVAWTFALTVALASLITLAALSRRVTMPVDGERVRLYGTRIACAGLVVQALLVILNFGAIFAGVGLGKSGSESTTPVPFTDGLYFSIVTWTTLGYGDFTPGPEMRLAAALEALVGYVYFGLIVGLIARAYGDDSIT